MKALLVAALCLMVLSTGCKDKLASLPPTIQAPSPPVAPPPVEKAPISPPAVYAPPFTPRLGTVLALAVSVREAARGNAKEVGRIHCGDVVMLDALAGDFYHLRVGDLQGYAHSAYLIELKPGIGLMPACEADHLGIRVKKDPKRVPLAQKPAINKALSPQLLAQADARPAPDAVPAAVVSTPPDAEPAVKPKRAPQNLLLSTAGIRAEVSFPHLLHTKATGCAKCHHPLAGGAEANKEKRCRDCHDANGKGESPVSSKDAFHRLCRDCHHALEKGPITCAECHGR